MVGYNNSMAFEPLINILSRGGSELEAGWLYLPEDEEWLLHTNGLIIDEDKLESNQVDSQGVPLIALQKKLVSTLDSDTIEDINHSAKALDCEFTEALLLEAFLYYYHYDAFLPYSGFKPIPREEYQINIDKNFYDCLGAERANTLCKKPTCQRGAITSSVFCRVHHFEMIKNKPCPFNH